LNIFRNWEGKELADEALRELIESPYRIIYRVYLDQIDILAVVHGSRRLPSELQKSSEKKRATCRGKAGGRGKSADGGKGRRVMGEAILSLSDVRPIGWGATFGPDFDDRLLHFGWVAQR
jgi:hypothetical protein